MDRWGTPWDGHAGLIFSIYHDWGDPCLQTFVFVDLSSSLGIKSKENEGCLVLYVYCFSCVVPITRLYFTCMEYEGKSFKMKARMQCIPLHCFTRGLFQSSCMLREARMNSRSFFKLGHSVSLRTDVCDCFPKFCSAMVLTEGFDGAAGDWRCH